MFSCRIKPNLCKVTTEEPPKASSLHNCVYQAFIYTEILDKTDHRQEKNNTLNRRGFSKSKCTNNSTAGVFSQQRSH